MVAKPCGDYALHGIFGLRRELRFNAVEGLFRSYVLEPKKPTEPARPETTDRRRSYQPPGLAVAACLEAPWIFQQAQGLFPPSPLLQNS
jgi:hypothetical protein